MPQCGAVDNGDNLVPLVSSHFQHLSYVKLEFEIRHWTPHQGQSMNNHPPGMGGRDRLGAQVEIWKSVLSALHGK
jgi:hypothetical protein